MLGGFCFRERNVDVEPKAKLSNHRLSVPALVTTSSMTAAETNRIRSQKPPSNTPNMTLGWDKGELDSVTLNYKSRSQDQP
jgi:hypothetical protein